MREVAYLSVCTGLGGCTAAVAPLGWIPAGYAEVEAFPSAILAARYGSNMPGEAPSGNAPPNLGDFTAIEPARLGRVNVLIGGTPCQAFSVAGKGLSLADARGNLTLAYAVLAHELVRFNGLQNAIWENVPGIFSKRDNPFGCFLGQLVGHDRAIPKPHGRSWPRAGMVDGSRARVAWRVLNAEHFGVPQRRERVFVVADFGNGADPAEVLFERKGLSGNLKQGRKKREDVARPVASSSHRGSGYRNDVDTADNLIVAHALSAARGNGGAQAADRETYVPERLAFGGNNTAGPIDVATACNAHGGPHGRMDFESETFVVGERSVVPALDASFGRLQGASGQDARHGHGHLLSVAFRTSPNDGAWTTGDRIDALTTGTDQTSHLVAFDTTQITHPENRCNPQPGDPVHPLAASAHPPAVAFDLRGREGGVQFEGPHDTANIRAASGGSSRSYIAHPLTAGMAASAHRMPQEQGALIPVAGQRWAVRRLTPTECERLQGLEDGHTKVAWRGKPADECPDGPRYKAIGNSWARPVVHWVCKRLDAGLKKLEQSTT